MHFPFTIHIHNYTVSVHTLFESLGMFIAFRYYQWLKRKNGDTIEQTNRLIIMVAAIFGAVFGSHLLGALENVPQWMAQPNPWLYLYGNKTLVGGLLGALVLVELVKKLIGEPQKSGDLFVFPLLLGMIIGRIGCLSAGVYEETYGLPSSLLWAMDLGDGIHRHPVTLYEIGFLLLLWLALRYISRKYVLQQGGVYKLFLIAYLVFRLLLDFIKPGWRYFFGLGSIQLACIAGLLYYARYIVKPKLLIQNYAS